ncbi:hypothetical protein [Sphingorhabdus sp.]|uniref:hypothetical protein n=1 Tax=Sphingorhabdus sp. TaxID=1902408 RepID=UPI0032B822F5
MPSHQIGEMLNAIGQHTANVLGKAPNDVFVFLRAGDQWMEGAIFDNLENEVIYHEPDRPMVEAVMRLWDVSDADRKWDTMLYDIKDGKFTVEYIYPDQLDPADGSPEIRGRALAERYGDKPVIYPEPDEGDWHELTEEDLVDFRPSTKSLPDFDLATNENSVLLNEIAQHVTEKLGKVPEDVFVFIEAGENWSDGEIYENQGKLLVSREFPYAMYIAINNLWEAAPAGKKWSVMLFDIKDGKFSVEYLYPEMQVDEDGEENDMHGEIRQSALSARYGNKSVFYPEYDDGQKQD